VKEVTAIDRNNLLNDYAREEQNMFYLRYPYLTIVSWFWKWRIHGHHEVVSTDAKHLFNGQDLFIYLHKPVGDFVDCHWKWTNFLDHTDQ
jgi:hypothetical protein